MPAKNIDAAIMAAFRAGRVACENNGQQTCRAKVHIPPVWFCRIPSMAAS
jgi:hypothetical protein